jgi:hypothetical protein
MNPIYELAIGKKQGRVLLNPPASAADTTMVEWRNADLPKTVRGSRQAGGSDVFKLNSCYTRRQIADEVGGCSQHYLPISSGMVVAGCFRKDLNPGAPEEVLVGTGPIIQSATKALYEQKTPIPVFIREAPKQWKYRGLFRVRGLPSDKKSIQRYSKDSIRTDVTSVLLLSPDSPSAAPCPSRSRSNRKSN